MLSQGVGGVGRGGITTIIVKSKYMYLRYLINLILYGSSATSINIRRDNYQH